PAGWGRIALSRVSATVVAAFVVAAVFMFVRQTPASGRSEGKGLVVGFTSTGDGTRWNLWRVNTDGGELEHLTNNKFREHSPAASPDGSLIAFAANTPRDANITEYA